MIEAFVSEKRRQIPIDLEEADHLSYSEIQQHTGLVKGTLNYHLKKLVAAGMIRNFLEANQDMPYTSFYEVSELRRRVIAGVLNDFRRYVY